MNTKGFVLSMVALMAAVLFGACSHGSTSSASASPTSTNNPDQALKQQTADVENRTNTELNDWDQRIDQFKNEEKHVKSRARKDEWKEAVADLEKKRDTVKSRLDDLKSAGTDTWQQEDSNLESAKTDLKTTYEQDVTKLGKTVTPHLQPQPPVTE